MDSGRLDKCEVRKIHPDRIEKAKEQDLGADKAEMLARLFKIFSDPSRLRILTVLGEQEMCVCDIAVFLDVSESAISHQLRHLRIANLVRNRRVGPVLYYRLADEHVKELISIGLEHLSEI